MVLGMEKATGLNEERAVSWVERDARCCACEARVKVLRTRTFNFGGGHIGYMAKVKCWDCGHEFVANVSNSDRAKRALRNKMPKVKHGH